jgi:hypothetical protein
MCYYIFYSIECEHFLSHRFILCTLGIYANYRYYFFGQLSHGSIT